MHALAGSFSQLSGSTVLPFSIALQIIKAFAFIMPLGSEGLGKRIEWCFCCWGPAVVKERLAPMRIASGW